MTHVLCIHNKSKNHLIDNFKSFDMYFDIFIEKQNEIFILLSLFSKILNHFCKFEKYEIPEKFQNEIKKNEILEKNFYENIKNENFILEKDYTNNLFFKKNYIFFKKNQFNTYELFQKFQ